MIAFSELNGKFIKKISPEIIIKDETGLFQNYRFRIVQVEGKQIAFYKSSGFSSGHTGSWFPAGELSFEDEQDNSGAISKLLGGYVRCHSNPHYHYGNSILIAIAHELKDITPGQPLEMRQDDFNHYLRLNCYHGVTRGQYNKLKTELDELTQAWHKEHQSIRPENIFGAVETVLDDFTKHIKNFLGESELGHNRQLQYWYYPHKEELIKDLEELREYINKSCKPPDAIDIAVVGSALGNLSYCIDIYLTKGAGKDSTNILKDELREIMNAFAEQRAYLDKMFGEKKDLSKKELRTKNLKLPRADKNNAPSVINPVVQESALASPPKIVKNIHQKSLFKRQEIMPEKCRKTDANSQIGLLNKGNTCYINTAIQTLLSLPNLPEIIAKRNASFAVVSYAPGDDAAQARSLCVLLDCLSKSQYGKLMDQSVIDNAWNDFLKHFHSRIVDNTQLGDRQEDSSFAFSFLAELLQMEAPLLQISSKHFGEVEFQGVYYAAKYKSESLPCFLLPWPSDTELTTLFKEQRGDIEGAKHPDADDASANAVPCSERNQIHMRPEADAFVLLPNHVPFKGEYAYTFSPTECDYHIPGEIELTIQDVKDIFVLASFGQKRGRASSGHYVAYRREGTEWYEVNDNVVTKKGKQEFSESALPLAITSALKSKQGHCSRQLVYVRKSTFVSQYHNAEVAVKEEAVLQRRLTQGKAAELQIEQELKVLQEKIEGIDQHHDTPALQIALALLHNLQLAKIQYVKNIGDLTMSVEDANHLFKQKCTGLIFDAKRGLENDLNWGDYLTNLLKSIINALVNVVTLGRVKGFFTPVQSVQMKVVEETEQNLKNIF